MSTILERLGSSIKETVAAAGGNPIAVLMNPHTLGTIAANVRGFAAELPEPSPIIERAVHMMTRDAIKKAWVESPPPAAFLDVCRSSGKFEDEASIVRFRNMLIAEL